MSQLLNGLLWYVAFLFSTTLHEASHAFIAMRLGDPTAYEGGHVTLNPIPYVRKQPMGMVIVPLISFVVGGWMIGWASVPYDREWAMQYPKRSAAMSLAGPAANLCLVLLTALIVRVGMMLGLFVPPESVDFTRVIASTGEGAFTTLASFVNVFLSLNLLLFIFNLLPLPPLDGSGVIPLFLGDDHARKYLAWVRNPSLSLFGILIAWKIFDFIYSPLHLAFINLLFYPEAHYR